MNTDSKSVGKFGYFDFENREYVITERQTPRPWINYIWNDEFLSIVTNTGQGYGFYQNKQSLRTNIVDGRRIYVQDTASGATWAAEGIDGPDQPENYSCRHGLGYTRINLTANGITSSVRIFIPQGLPAEVWTLTLENTTKETRSLRVVPVLDTRIDGEPGLQGYYVRSHSIYNPDLNAILFQSDQPENGNPPQCFMATHEKLSGYDCRWDDFFGPHYRDGFPQAIRNGEMGNSDRCEFEKSTLAMESRIELAPGETKTLHFFIGHFQTSENVAGIKAALADDEKIEAAFSKVRKTGPGFSQPLEIQTGDSTFDSWCDTWLQQQLAYNATWARDYFNGYRDLCQDAESLTLLDPARARLKLHEILSYQYSSGFAPRAWLNGKAMDHGHSDSPVWITYAVYALIMETGDLSLLEETVPYYGGEETGSLYDHCKRALDWYWTDRGENGLCLFRKGDWNDAMIRAGWDGKGTSAWLTMAYHRALVEFAELARLSGQISEAEEAEVRAVEIKKIINTVAWDGEYFLRGTTDEGERIGSSQNTEGTMYLNAQSWAVIADAAEGDRGLQAMEAVDRYLDDDIGALTIKDHYTGFDIHIGQITGQRPGAYQNQSAYCHSNTFKIAADCILGRADIAWESLEKILPFSARKQEFGEPFVIPNCYFGPQSGYRYDRPGQSWKTGTAGWILTILTLRMFGLKPTIEGLRIEPCLPAKLKTCAIKRTFRGATYAVRYLRDNGEGVRITVDGEPLKGTLLPHQAGKIFEVEVRRP